MAKTVREITHCVHASDGGWLSTGQVKCAMGVFRPHRSFCATCPLYSGPARSSRVRGLGDTIAGIINLAGMKKKCSACDRRRSWLNWLAPYGPIREVVLRAIIIVLIVIVIFK